MLVQVGWLFNILLEKFSIFKKEMLLILPHEVIENYVILQIQENIPIIF